jgi:polyisoprenoid-binding protein YceI
MAEIERELNQPAPGEPDTMHMKYWKKGAVIATAFVVLSSCVAPNPASTPSNPAQPVSAVAASAIQHEELSSVYAGLGRESGRVFTLDPQTSAVRIYVFRGGTAARLGHNHVLAAPQFMGMAYVAKNGAANTRFDLEFRLDQLEIDNPAYRATLGKAFASVLSPEAIAGTREHMLGDANMQADKYPTVAIHSRQITGEFPRYAARIDVDMHGQSHEMWVPLQVDGLPDGLTVSGSFVLRQTDFGIKPFSVMGGMMSVQDEVVIEFKLHGQ